MTRVFLAGWSVALVGSTLLVQNLLGPEEARRLLLAWTAGLPGSLASLILVEQSKYLPPQQRTTLIAAGHPIRLLLALAISFGYWCVILSEPTTSFWVWFVITYALTLAGDVWLTLRVIRASSSDMTPYASARSNGSDWQQGSSRGS